MSPPTDRASARRGGATTLAFLLSLSALGACDVPSFEGPQLQSPPAGFILRPQSRAEHGMLTFRPQIHHDAWVQPAPPYSTIHINGYEGELTLEDAMAAQDSLRSNARGATVDFGGIEPLSIDERDAWGWEERTDSAGATWVTYRAMVPYDTITYTVEVSTSDPALTAGAPASLQAIVSTFAVGETTYNWPLILLGIAVMAFALYLLRERSRASARRLQSVDLVTVEKRDEDA